MNSDQDHGTADHGMTHGDAESRHIGLLLAEATDAVRIGMAPYQAVVRGGRRRRTRRCAVAAVAAVVIAGSAGTLALTGTTGGEGSQVSPATRPHTAQERHVYAPQQTTVGSGRDGGKDWEVTVDVWAAPRDEAEAARQYDAMRRTYPVRDQGGLLLGGDPSMSIGRGRFYVRVTVGDQSSMGSLGMFTEGEERLSGKSIEVSTSSLDGLGPGSTDGKLSGSLETGSTDSKERRSGDTSAEIVIGTVAPTAQQVRITWSDGTTTDVDRDTEGLDTPRILDAQGCPDSWFVVSVPRGVSYESAKVSK
ncbi:hypothetical protein [Streptomyces acidicola]|uniref:hypothetical protein n=1 Tax=Streptomyces acidicola TaxID=2596892 RepID=UPI0034350604